MTPLPGVSAGSGSWQSRPSRPPRKKKKKKRGDEDLLRPRSVPGRFSWCSFSAQEYRAWRGRSTTAIIVYFESASGFRLTKCHRGQIILQVPGIIAISWLSISTRFSLVTRARNSEFYVTRGFMSSAGDLLQSINLTV